MIEADVHHRHENCRQLLGSLSEYVDGSLDELLCAEIERHMSGCENCRMVVDSLRKTIYLYHATSPQAALPEEVRSRLYKRLELEDLLNP